MNNVSAGYPINIDSDNSDTSYTEAQKIINEINKIYTAINDIVTNQIPDLLVDLNADKVDGHHCDNTANNAPYLNSAGNLTVNTEGTAYNIPNGNVGGNIWIA